MSSSEELGDPYLDNFRDTRAPTYAAAMRDWATLNPEVIAEFRANDGVVARFGGMPVIILHTIGARTGELHEIPLIPVFEGERMLLYGTAAGSPKHPGWYYNLRAHPRVTAEYGSETFEVDVVQLGDHEAAGILSMHAMENETLVQYIESAAPRIVPVFEVHRV